MNSRRPDHRSGAARPERDLAACAESHRGLLSALAGLTDDLAARPSLLPGWTVGHVVAHLARNADGNVRMLRGAERGEVADMYPGGLAEREAEIEAGAGRPASELLADLRSATATLEDVWAATTPVGWAGSGMTMRGPAANAQLPYRRLIETELHRFDLGPLDRAGEGEGGYTFAEMPSWLVRSEVRRLGAVWSSRRPMGLTDLAPAVLALDEPQRAAWLTGRLQLDGVEPASVL